MADINLAGYSKNAAFFYLLKEDDNDNIIIKMVTHIYSGVSLQKRLAQFD